MSAYLACMGTPTEIIRMAPLVHALRTRDHRVTVLHVGLQAELTDALYDFFDMPPEARVTLLRQAPRLSQLTAELLSRLDTHLQQMAPDGLLVQGESTCALAGTLAASCQDVPVAHLDAGCRTAGRAAFPEDLHGGLIDHMARWHFTSSPGACQTLLDEGIARDRIHEAGNSAIDAALWARQRMGNICLKNLVPPDVMRFLRLHEHGQLLLVSTHQRENRGQALLRVAAAVAGLLQLHPQLTVVWPLPAQPQLRAEVHRGLACLPAHVRQRLCLSEPLPYPARITMLELCRFVLTDSDALVQEASALQKPVLILREHSAHPELVEAGGALMAGNMAHRIVTLATELLGDPLLATAIQLPSSPFGDGQAAQRMAEILSQETESRMGTEKHTA